LVNIGALREVTHERSGPRTKSAEVIPARLPVARFTEFLPTLRDGLIALAYFALAAAAILALGTTTPVWLANAVALAALLHKEPKRWPAFLLLIWVADVAALSLGLGEPILLALCDILEVLLAATLVRVTGGLGTPLFKGWALLRFILICLAAPLVSTTAGAGLLWMTDGLPFWSTWLPWYAGVSLGSLMLTPFLLSWSDAEVRSEALSTDRLPLTIVSSVCLFLLAVIIFSQPYPAFIFATFPALLLVVWSGGLLGATLGAVMLATVSIWFTLNGQGSVVQMVLPQTGLVPRIAAVQVYLAAVFLASFPVAVILAQQRRLTQELARTAAARSDFLAAMSHEIRTPLAGVLGMADLLVSEDLNSQQRQFVNSIRTSGRHLANVVNDILDFSRLEAGTIELEQIDFSMPQVLERLRSIVNPLVQERDLELRFELADHSPPLVRGDPTRLKQVLLNLVGNAIKFTEQGSVTVGVSHKAGASGLLFRFEVTDTGIGIPADKQQDLFMAFSQADSSTTRRFGGTGLGLSISKRLVDAMGGEIGVVSTDGAGSMFWFEVPFQPSEVAALAESGASNAPAFSPRRILVAEDVELNREILKHGLGRDGHEVVFAENGAQAVELIQHQPFDLVLMDVQMPVMDGVEATRRIRKLDPPLSDIPIFALTANVMASEREKYLAAGMNDCLLKPIDWKRLRSAIGGVAAIATVPLEALDPEMLEQLRLLEEDSPGLTARLTNMFLEGSPALIARIEAALRSGETLAMSEHAHALKGSSANMGAKRLAAICGAIEQHAREGDLVSARMAFEELTGEFELARSALQRLHGKAVRPTGT
jgi:signal transduction histidine kinase/CheY-like chemotaxis protein